MKNINYTLWDNYETYAKQRGNLILAVLQSRVDVENSHILDFGCGSGGISLQMAHAGARVTALDIDEWKLDQLRAAAEREQVHLNIVNKLPHQQKFDMVLLVDVLEHVSDPFTCIKQITTVLKSGGLIYLSTPNRYAGLNLVCDPHFSLPLIAAMNRHQVRKIIADMLHWQFKDRPDFPQLLSYSRFYRMMQQSKLHWQWINKKVADYAFHHPQALWNRPWHLKMVSCLTHWKWHNVLLRFISDKGGFFNKWLNPTWFVLAEKVPSKDEY